MTDAQGARSEPCKPTTHTKPIDECWAQLWDSLVSPLRDARTWGFKFLGKIRFGKKRAATRTQARWRNCGGNPHRSGNLSFLRHRHNANGKSAIRHDGVVPLGGRCARPTTHVHDTHDTRTRLTNRDETTTAAEVGA